MMLVDQLTPATPKPSLPRAAIVPETWVPWPGLAALVTSSGLLSPSTKSQPCRSLACPVLPGCGLVQMFGARSCWVEATPVSTTPTTTFGLPVVMSHASGASMSASALVGNANAPALELGTCWPVSLSPQSLTNSGSSGVSAMCRT